MSTKIETSKNLRKVMRGFLCPAMTMILLSGSILASANPLTFDSPTDFAVFGLRNDVLVDKAVQGDFDGDGNLDLLYIRQFNFLGPNQQVARVNVILGNGNGGALGAIPEFIPTNDSRNTWSIESGSLNGDGHLDVVLVNSETHNVTILLGNGDGTFIDQAVSTLPLMVGPRYQGLGDIDGDVDTDIVIGNWGGTLVVLTNDGAGNFTLNTTITGQLPGNPSRTDIEIGDLNGDGMNDIVSSRVNGIDVYLNTGYPSFSSSTIATTFTGQLLLEDFNGDNTLDLGTYTPSGTDILIYDGDGTGAFSPRSSVYPTGTSNSTSIASADFNGDGLLDIATANVNNPGNVSILLGDATGEFAAPQFFPTPSTLIFPQRVLAGDMNNDGKPDILTLNKNSGPRPQYSSIMLNATETEVVDETPPTITTCPVDLVLECDPIGNPTAIQDWLNSFAATDDVGIQSLGNDFAGLSNGCGATGTALVTFTAIDTNGNESHCTASVTLQDNLPPGIETPASSVSFECNTADHQNQLDEWLASNGGATASDTCGSVTWSNDFSALSNDCGATGTTTVTFIATDECGNSSTSTASFTIEDTTPPSIDTAASEATVECYGGGNLGELQSWLESAGGAIASDGCGNVTWTHDFTHLSDDCAQTGSATVTFTATDDSGNRSTTTATFNIVDTTEPDVNCHLVLVPTTKGSSSGSNSGGNGKTATFEVVYDATDVCSSALTTNATINVGSEAVSVVNGQRVVLKIKKKVKIRTKKGVLNMEGPAFELRVNSVDDCGNQSSCVTSPVFPTKPSSSSGSSSSGSSKAGSSKSGSSKSGSSQSGSGSSASSGSSSKNKKAKKR